MAFLAGSLFGFILTGAIFVIVIGKVRPRRKKQQQQIDVWSDDHYRQAPPATTQLKIKNRSFTF